MLVPLRSGVSAKRAIARFQTLCCLGLGGPLAIPAALGELHKLIGSTGNEFYWADANFDMANVYMEAEQFAAVTPLYFQEFHERRDRETRLSFAELMRTPYASPVDDFFHRVLKVPVDEFRRTDVYNLVLRPLGAERRLQLKVTEHGRPLGALHLNRTARDPDFSERDRHLLNAVGPFIAHALHEGPKVWDSPAEIEDHAVVIARVGDGRIEALSRSAERLLHMASRARIDPGWSNPLTLPAPVVARCRGLLALFDGRPQPEAPVWQHGNAWGRFTFRICPLSWNGSASDAAAVIIERELPIQLRFFGPIARLGLSAREQQFSLLAAAGHGREEIAARMGVTRNTAIAHGRSAYAKLGVQSRVELVGRLRALAEEDGAEAQRTVGLQPILTTKPTAH